jgi:hypothetical protein
MRLAFALFVLVTLALANSACGTRTASSTEAATTSRVPFAIYPPDGWTQVGADNLTLWLPPVYPDLIPPERSGTRRNSLLQPESSAVRLAFGDQSARPSTVVAVRDPAAGQMTLDAYGEIVAEELSMAAVEPLQVSRTMVNLMPALRYVRTYLQTTTRVRELLFLFVNGGTAWTVAYTSREADFALLLPRFQASVSTISFGPNLDRWPSCC